MISVIVFDFDGVIIDSESIKQDGYRLMFSDFNETVPEDFVQRACEMHRGGGVGRISIIEEILSLLGKKDNLELYVERYAHSVGEVLKNVPINPDAATVINVLHGKYPLYINSLTPDLELNTIVKRLGIRDKFIQVMGASQTKVENLKYVGSQEGAAPDEILFIGDSAGDETVALMYGCKFLMLDSFAKEGGVTPRGSSIIQSLVSIPTYC